MQIKFRKTLCLPEMEVFEWNQLLFYRVETCKFNKIKLCRIKFIRKERLLPHLWVLMIGKLKNQRFQRELFKNQLHNYKDLWLAMKEKMQCQEWWNKECGCCHRSFKRARFQRRQHSWSHLTIVGATILDPWVRTTMSHEAWSAWILKVLILI